MSSRLESPTYCKELSEGDIRSIVLDVCVSITISFSNASPISLVKIGILSQKFVAVRRDKSFQRISHKHKLEIVSKSPFVLHAEENHSSSVGYMCALFLSTRISFFLSASTWPISSWYRQSWVRNKTETCSCHPLIYALALNIPVKRSCYGTTFSNEQVSCRLSGKKKKKQIQPYLLISIRANQSEAY